MELPVNANPVTALSRRAWRNFRRTLPWLVRDLARTGIEVSYERVMATARDHQVFAALVASLPAGWTGHTVCIQGDLRLVCTRTSAI